MSTAPRSARHDFAAVPRRTWEQRVGAPPHDWTLAVLGAIAGCRVCIERRDGSRVEGTVRQATNGRGWSAPLVGPGAVVYLEPGPVPIAVTQIVAVSALPDRAWSHESHGWTRAG